MSPPVVRRRSADYPGKRVGFKRAFADDDHVSLRCHQIWPGNLEYAGVDICRFDGGARIVGYWEEFHVVPGAAANNTMF